MLYYLLKAPPIARAALALKVHVGGLARPKRAHAAFAVALTALAQKPRRETLAIARRTGRLEVHVVGLAAAKGAEAAFAATAAARVLIPGAALPVARRTRALAVDRAGRARAKRAHGLFAVALGTRAGSNRRWCGSAGGSHTDAAKHGVHQAADVDRHIGLSRLRRLRRHCGGVGYAHSGARHHRKVLTTELAEQTGHSGWKQNTQEQTSRANKPSRAGTRASNDDDTVVDGFIGWPIEGCCGLIGWLMAGC